MEHSPAGDESSELTVSETKIFIKEEPHPKDDLQNPSQLPFEGVKNSFANGAEKEKATLDGLKEELGEGESSDGAESKCENPYMNGIVVDEIDNSGLYYAYQEDIITTNVEEEIITTTALAGGTHDGDKLPARDNNVQRISKFSLSPDHSYTSHTLLDDTTTKGHGVKGSAVNFYEKFCGDANIIGSNDCADEEAIEGNNLEVSEIVYVKAENGIDNIQEITLLVKPELDSIGFQDTYKVIANGDSEVVDDPLRNIGIPKITSTKSLATGFPMNYKLLGNVEFLSTTNSKPLSNNGSFKMECDGTFANQFRVNLANDSFDTDEDECRPPYSYSQLIVQAIASTKEKQLTLNGIYAYITENYKYYRETDEKGWKNSIRHNLSLNPHFFHVPRLPHPNELSRKGGYWRIDSIYENRLFREAFSKKKKGYENKKYLKYLACNKRKSDNLPT